MAQNSKRADWAIRGSRIYISGVWFDGGARGSKWSGVPVHLQKWGAQNYIHVFYFAPHTPLFLGAKNLETVEIWERKKKMCNESQGFSLSVLKMYLPRFPYLSKACYPLSGPSLKLSLHFLVNFYAFVYELLNFKIVGQKLVHVCKCIILYSQI